MGKKRELPLVDHDCNPGFNRPAARLHASAVGSGRKGSLRKQQFWINQQLSPKTHAAYTATLYRPPPEAAQLFLPTYSGKRDHKKDFLLTVFFCESLILKSMTMV